MEPLSKQQMHSDELGSEPSPCLLKSGLADYKTIIQLCKNAVDAGIANPFQLITPERAGNTKPPFRLTIRGGLMDNSRRQNCAPGRLPARDFIRILPN